MKPLFADTFYYLALLSSDDPSHDDSIELTRELSSPMVTTAWVLTELGDALAAPENRGLFVGFLDGLRRNPHVTIVPPSQDLFEKAVNLYRRRPDKSWTLTDCASFVVMRERELTDALTGDHHFEQAGFKTLLT